VPVPINNRVRRFNVSDYVSPLPTSDCDNGTVNAPMWARGLKREPQCLESTPSLASSLPV